MIRFAIVDNAVRWRSLSERKSIIAGEGGFDLDFRIIWDRFSYERLRQRINPPSPPPAITSGRLRQRQNNNKIINIDREPKDRSNIITIQQS